MYTGSAWTLIGPTTVSGSGVTQVITESPEDNTGVNRSILKLVTNDTVVGVVSNLAFTPSSTDTLGAALYQQVSPQWHKVYNFQQACHQPNSGELQQIQTHWAEWPRPTI